MNIKYLFFRALRRSMPRCITNILLKINIIKPGLETKHPDLAIKRYTDSIGKSNITFNDKNILILGYGGNFSTSSKLLQMGAKHIFLCDPYASIVNLKNTYKYYKDYFILQNKKVTPDPKKFTLIHEDIGDYLLNNSIFKTDIILSSSVFEHLSEPDNILKSLVKVSTPSTIQIHFIDLRDHYFKYPFQMLCYSKKAWEKYLNPDSNLNRFRYFDYKELFEKYFINVEIEITESNQNSFNKVNKFIRHEFLSGDITIDCATQIKITASKPINFQ